MLCDYSAWCCRQRQDNYCRNKKKSVGTHHDVPLSKQVYTLSDQKCVALLHIMPYYSK